MALTTKAFGATGLVVAILFIAIAAMAADLEVSVEGLRSAEGNVRVALHRRADDAEFPDGDGVAGMFRPAEPDVVRIVFVDLPPGDYAVAVFHDADGDEELGTNILGIPIEGYGFSNDARGFMGPPSFDAAAVTVGADDDVRSIVVTIGYPGP